MQTSLIAGNSLDTRRQSAAKLSILERKENKMKIPNDQFYNIDHNNEIQFNTLNIDQRIMILNEAEKKKNR